MSTIKASKELNNILSKQRSPLLKTGLDYEEVSSSNHLENKKLDETNSQNTNIHCKQKETKMKQVPESGIQIRNINQALLRNKANRKEDNHSSYTNFFSMVTIIVVLILATKMQSVHLILEICNQRTINCCNIEQDSQQVNKNNIQLGSQLKE